MLSTFFTATKAYEEFHHDYLKGYVMKIKLCPNEADETTESENDISFDSNDGRAVASGGAVGAQAPPVFGRSVSPISTRGGTFSPPSIASPPRFSDLASTLDGESDTSENCRCRRYCYCQVDEPESLENESDEGAVSTSEGSREIEDLEESSDREG